MTLSRFGLGWKLYATTLWECEGTNINSFDKFAGKQSTLFLEHNYFAVKTVEKDALTFDIDVFKFTYEPCKISRNFIFQKTIPAMYTGYRRMGNHRICLCPPDLSDCIVIDYLNQTLVTYPLPASLSLQHAHLVHAHFPLVLFHDWGLASQIVAFDLVRQEIAYCIRGIDKWLFGEADKVLM